MTVRAAIYLRVSKSDGSQSVENQRPEVEQLAREYATTRPAAIRLNYGVQRSERGIEPHAEHVAWAR